MTFEAKTLGELRELTKDMPDSMPLYIDDEGGDELLACLSIEKREFEIENEYDWQGYGLSTYGDVEVLVLGVT